MLSQLRKDGLHAYNVKRDDGRKVIVILDRKVYNEDEADEMARISDAVSRRGMKKINSQLGNLLAAMDDCTDLYPQLDETVKHRLITTAQQILEYDYKTFTVLLEDYRDAYDQIEGGSEPAKSELKEVHPGGSGKLA
jgi:hypothetical protein